MKNINDFSFALHPKPGGEDKMIFLFKGFKIDVVQYNGMDPVLKKVMPGKNIKPEAIELLIHIHQPGNPSTQHVCTIPKALVQQSGDEYKHGLFHHLIEERKKYLIQRPYG